MKTICLDQFKIYPNNSKILRFFNVRIKNIMTKLKFLFCYICVVKNIIELELNLK